jgi:hypothetical protein
MGHVRTLELPDNSSTRNPQFTTRSMGVAETSPSVPRRDGEGAYKLVGEPALIASNGPRLGGLLMDKIRIPLRSASVRTPHLFHHGIPKVLVNPRSKGIKAFDLPSHSSYSNL